MRAEVYILFEYNPENNEYFVKKEDVGVSAVDEYKAKYKQLELQVMEEKAKIIEIKKDGSTEIIADYTNGFDFFDISFDDEDEPLER